MNHWLGLRTISPLLFVWLLLFACSALDGEPAEFVVIGGNTIPEEGSRRKPGFALEGEEITSPGPTITVRVGEPVTIAFKNVHDFPEPHDFTIVAEMDNLALLTKLLVDPLWGAETEWLPFGEQQTITFTPDTPGSYFYVCTNSDHVSRGMWGSFIVEE